MISKISSELLEFIRFQLFVEANQRYSIIFETYPSGNSEVQIFKSLKSASTRFIREFAGIEMNE
jgi:hypothetical protein